MMDVVILTPSDGKRHLNSVQLMLQGDKPLAKNQLHKQCEATLIVSLHDVDESPKFAHTVLERHMNTFRLHYQLWLTPAPYDEGFVPSLLDHVLPLSSMSYTGIITEEAIYIGIIQNGLNRHWCWKSARFGKKFWVVGWSLLIYKLLGRKKLFTQLVGGLTVKYSCTTRCLDFLLGMSLLLTNQDRKDTAALIRCSESWVYAKDWTLNSHPLLFSNPSSHLHEQISQSAQSIDLFFSKVISPVGRLTWRHPFYCDFSSSHLSLENHAPGSLLVFFLFF